MTADRNNRETHNPYTVLVSAGHKRGERPSPGGRATYAAAGVPGFVLETWTGAAGRYTLVDHQGPGREAALAQYAADLTAGGFTVEVAPKSDYVAKRVVHVRAWPSDPK